MNPRTFGTNSCWSDQLLNVVGVSHFEWREMVRKEPLVEPKVKETIRVKTMCSRPRYMTDRHLICNPDTLRHEKQQFWR